MERLSQTYELTKKGNLFALLPFQIVLRIMRSFEKRMKEKLNFYKYLKIKCMNVYSVADNKESNKIH